MTRTVTTSSDIKNRLKKTGIVTIENLEITDRCDVIQSDIRCEGVIFYNCHFKEVLCFNDISISYGMQIWDCVFDSSLLFYSCKFERIQPEFSRHKHSLIIANCKVDYALVIQGCKLNSNIDIRGNEDLKIKSELLNAIVSHNEIENGSLLFNNCHIKNQCEIESNRVLTKIYIKETEVNSKALIKDNHCTEIIFDDNCFKKIINIGNGIVKNLIFNKGIYEDTVSVNSIVSSGILTINGGDFKKELFVDYKGLIEGEKGGFDQIYLHSCSFGNGAYFVGGNDIFDPYKISSIDILSTEMMKGEISFRNFDVTKVSFQGNNSNSKIRIDNVKIVKFKAEHFRNSSVVQFFDVRAIPEENSSFEIVNSNLGAIELYNTFLNSFKTVLIRNSIVSEIITSNVRWFKREQLVLESSTNKKVLESYWRNDRELFRQLKYAMDKQGNRVQALEFKRYEMNAYREELNNQEMTFGNFTNRVILWLGQSNDYGLNWIKPTILIFLFTALFYSLIVVGISKNLQFSYAKNCYDIYLTVIELTNYSPAFFKMFNPLFVFDKAFITNKEESFTLSFFEFLHRIILTYLLFQVVSAFRKYVK